MQQSQGTSQTGGTQFVVDYDAGKKQYDLKLLSCLKDVHSVNVEQDFVNFVANLGKKIERFFSPVVVYSTHTRQKQIFRGTPTHGGKFGVTGWIYTGQAMEPDLPRYGVSWIYPDFPTITT